jgi:hypothetical protein
MFVYIKPLPSNQIAIAKEKTNGSHPKVLQKTLDEIIEESGKPPSGTITCCSASRRKENRSEATHDQACQHQAKLGTSGQRDA